MRVCLFLIPAFCLAPLLLGPAGRSQEKQEAQQVRSLPHPERSGGLPIDDCLASRRTRRSFAPGPLKIEEVAQLLWSAQGITDPARGFRTAPSAGALYPLDVFLVSGEGGVEGLKAGVYCYLPSSHGLEKIAPGDLRESLAQACLGQGWMARAPVLFVFTAEYARTERKYGARGQRYAHIEAGHACQNLLLQVEALGLSAALVGAFDDRRVSERLRLPGARDPLLVVPVGRRR